MLRLLATRRLARSTVGRGALLGKAHGFARALSSKPFNLADIGEGIAEVEVLQWFVKPDDSVEQVCACGSLSYGALFPRPWREDDAVCILLSSLSSPGRSLARF